MVLEIQNASRIGVSSMGWESGVSVAVVVLALPPTNYLACGAGNKTRRSRSDSGSDKTCSPSSHTRTQEASVSWSQSNVVVVL